MMTDTAAAVEIARERLRLTRALIDTPAWTLLARDWSEETELLKHQLVYNKSADAALIGFWRGKLDVLERLIHLSKIIDAAEAGLEEQAPVEND